MREGEFHEHEDLEDARVKRAAKDAAEETKGKGKRGRKRQSTTQMKLLQ